MTAEAFPGRPAGDARDEPRVVGMAASTVREFHDLYLREFPNLTRYAARLVDDRDLANELTQDAFTRLFARWRRVDDPGAYVFLILTNLVRDHWRRRDRERRALRWLRPAPPREPSSREAAVVEGVERLPARLREPVLLHYYADLPVESVAATLGRPLGTVKRQLHEARTLIEQYLRDDEEQR
ncbi:MAG TPA: sigma-70 family RNA polymerase sigma factor [Mycobacteriales bacterium]|nr:sigma-70 family RNA polymerase sigma factor [Mycobacteriales bacterium]